MSQDQKPTRIRAVSGSTGGTADPQDEDGSSLDTPPLPAQAVPAAAPSLAGRIVFLLGCGAGGAAVAALPHFMAIRL